MAFHNDHLTVCLAILFLLWPLHSSATDPSPLQDFCIADFCTPFFMNGFPCKNPALASSSDFFYEGLMKRGTVFDPLNVNLTQVDVFTFPALNTLGISMNRVEFLPDGLNPPHTHPRATELSLVVEGFLLAGWVSTDYVLYWKIVSAGELFLIPPGLVHFQLNIGRGRALYYASFNSQNPGIQKIPQALFNSMPLISDNVLTETFNVNATIIEFIKSKVAQLN